jgi:hypothetical protein
MILSMLGHATAKPELTMHRVQIMVDEGYYAIDISYDGSLDAQLRIACMDQCKSAATYSETKPGLFLLGAFGDGDSFITLWAAGSAEWIIIYRINDDIGTRILEQPARTLPDFEGTPDGRRVIVLHTDT